MSDRTSNPRVVGAHSLDTTPRTVTVHFDRALTEDERDAFVAFITNEYGRRADEKPASKTVNQFTDCAECGGMVLSKAPGGYVAVEELREEMADNERLRIEVQSLRDDLKVAKQLLNLRGSDEKSELPDLGVEDGGYGDDIDCPTCGQGHTGIAAKRLRKRLQLETSAAPPAVCTCSPPVVGPNFVSASLPDPSCPTHWRQALIQNSSPEEGEPCLNPPTTNL